MVSSWITRCQNNRGRVYIFKKDIDYANDIYGNTTNIIKNENLFNIMICPTMIF